jgi:hypothetical protein
MHVTRTSAICLQLSEAEPGIVLLAAADSCSVSLPKRPHLANCANDTTNRFVSMVLSPNGQVSDKSQLEGTRSRVVT